MLAYGKVEQFGRSPVIEGILEGNIEIEEKLDGSQFRIEIAPGKIVTFGSKSIDNNIDKMFNKAIENTLNGLTGLLPNEDTITIFAEYLQSPSHNTLKYDKTPTNNICIFDIARNGVFMERAEKEAFASLLGFDCIPLLWKGNGREFTQEMFDSLLTSKSYLGGATVEGIVIKNRSKFIDPVRFPHFAGHFMKAKLVRKEFKEANRENWGYKKGSIEQIIDGLVTNARYEKAYQHLRDSGQLQLNMRDIPSLMKEVCTDILEEEGESIKQIIWKAAWERISRGIMKPIPEWYKMKLAGDVLKENEIAKEN